MKMTTRRRSVRAACLLSGLALLFAACEGDEGEPGQQGAAGYSCWDTNTNGKADLPVEDVNQDGRVDLEDCQGQGDGQDGLSCWDLNKNGRPDVDVEDRNLDGTVDVDDCVGAPGLDCWDLNDNGEADLPAEDANQDGQVNVDDCSGADGNDGLDCWDLNGNGEDDPEEDVNADGQVNVTDCAGISTGSLMVEVIDAATGTQLGSGEGSFGPATVTLYPPVAGPSEADELGRVSFPRLPVGVYTVTATADTLQLDGTTVLESDLAASSAPATLSIVAASSNFARLQISRLPPTTPLTALHDSSWASGAAYTQANCVICHGDKLNELSRDADVPRWHSITGAQGNSVHASVGCVFCHETRVDLAESSSASLRKQVDIGKCALCHPNYPSLP